MGGSGERCTPTSSPEVEPDGWRIGWQHEASSRVERRFREAELMARFTDTEKAFLRSQSGPLAGAALAAVPTSFHTRLEPHPFVSSVASSPSSSSSSSVCACLLMRPFIRYFWPPSSCMRAGRAVVKTWVRSGVGSCKDLSRGRREGHYECHGP